MGLCVCVPMSVCVSPSKLRQCVGLCVCVNLLRELGGREMTQLQGRQSSCER